MQIISCQLENFASYKELNFDFQKQGLTLIQGPTGSGKSTLCDAIPWVLFGTTAKNGAVDEILSWAADGRTYGHVVVELDGHSLWIVRTRKPNDLYYIVDGVWENSKRGKDLVDTQKHINALLGIDSALYLSGAYFHEFSQTAQFFITTAKNRRAICEQLVDLSLAKTLQADLTASRKELSEKRHSYQSDIRMYADRLVQLKKQDYEKRFNSFETDKANKLALLSGEMLEIDILPKTYFTEQYENIKEARKSLGSEKCPHCGSKMNSDMIEDLAEIERGVKNEERDNDFKKEKIKLLRREIENLKTSENVFQMMMVKKQEEMTSYTEEMDSSMLHLENTETKIADIELLLEVVSDFRSVTIKNTIQQIESKTNQLLSAHFDAEIKVIFEVTDADKLDVIILKDGNTCTYSQLSKGQRQLLKLCFGVSVMRQVSNHSGVKFNAIFLDESMDGLDDNFKVKAFNLLKTLELEYESIFVVEHSESLKALFDNKYSVQLINGKSEIEKS